MTPALAANRPWYDTPWLVILLCIFIFPVGLYALWKSKRFVMGWKIAGTAITVLVIIGLFAESSDAKEVSKPVAAVTADTTLSGKKIPAKASYLFETPEDFSNAFNKYTALNTLDFHIEDLKIEDGEVQNTFQYMFNDHLGILGAVNKTDGSVKEITMIGSGDGSFKSGGNIILCMIAIIATVDPTLTADDRMDILKELGLLGEKKGDIMNLSANTGKNRFRYFISSSRQTGFIFGASPVISGL